MIRALRGRYGLVALTMVLSLLLGLFLGYWFLGPDYVDRKVRQRLAASLGRRGLVLEQARVAWDHGTQVVVTDVRVAGSGVQASIERVVVQLSGHALLRGEPRVTRVEVGAVAATIDLARPLVTGAQAGEGGDGGALAAAEVAFGPLAVEVRQGDRRLAAFEGRIEALERLETGLQLRLQGEARFAGQAAQVVVEGQASRGEQVLRVRPADETPVYVHAVPGVGRLVAREARVQRTAEGLRAGVGGLEVQLGPAGAPLLALTAAQADAARGPGGWVLRAEAGTLDLQREKLKEIKDLAKALAESVRATLPRSGLPGLPGAEGAADGAGPTLELADLAVLESGQPIAQAVAVTATARRLQVSGEVAGGEATVVVGLTDGRPGPVELDFARLDLARLPAPLPRLPVAGRVTGGLRFEDPAAVVGLLRWIRATLPAAMPPELPPKVPPKPPKGTPKVKAGPVPKPAPPPPEAPPPPWAPPPNPMIIKGNLRIEGGRLFHRALAAEPIDAIDLEVGGTLDLDPPRGRALVPEGYVKSGPVVGRFTARLSGWPDHPALDVDLRGEPVPCEQAIRQVPPVVLGPYRHVELSGTFAPTLKMHLPWKSPYSFKLETTGIGDDRACVVQHLRTLPEGWPPVEVGGARDDVDWLMRDFVLTVREGVTPGAVVQVGPGTPDYVPLSDMPEHVAGAAYLSEEMGFFVGGGISLPLINKAIITNLEKRRFAYGGSTVTQQLVKNLFLTRDKTLARKFQEGLVASRIAAVIPKHRTLELYINCIEFGQDLYGVRRAARYYFEKEPAQLTPLESVFLANIKPAPRNATWYVKKGHSPIFPWWVDRTKEILRRLVDRQLIPPEAVEAAAPYVLTWQDGRYQGAPDGPGHHAPGTLPAGDEPVDEDAPDGVWR